MVFTVNHGDAGQRLRSLWASKELQKVWSRDGLGFKAASWKPPQEFVQIADWVGFNYGKGGSSSGSGNKGGKGGKGKAKGGRSSHVERRASVQPTKKSKSMERDG